MKTEALAVLVFALAIIIADGNAEGDALNAWKIVLEDPNNVLQSWDPTLLSPCTWFHVSCNSENSVTGVALVNANLTGPLVPQLGQLANLQYLEASRNKLSGAIPTELANLTKLVMLGLDHNQLSGVIPVAFGKLRSLRFLRLNSNKLSGSLPDAVNQLVLLGSLQLLNVSDNQLEETVRVTNETAGLAPLFKISLASLVVLLLPLLLC